MEDGRYFEQIANPEYAEQYTAVLAELHNKGAQLAQSAPDEVGPMTDTYPNGPKKFELTLHQESMIDAGLPEEFLSGSVVFFEASDWPKSAAIVLRRTHQVENIVNFDIEPIQEPILPGDEGVGRPVLKRTSKAGTVVIADAYGFYDPKCSRPEPANEQELWPLSHSAQYTDLEGNNVLPIFKKPPSPLTALEYGIDLRGGEMLVKLLESEARIREVELD